ncbi:MAG: hypothetical protein ABSE17_02305 [Candidatus Levyibacteriota bacterium]
MKKIVHTDAQIKSYLDTIKNSIEGDVGKALPVYSSIPCGFFAVPRLLFPEIDGLGSYLTGKPEATVENITTYLRLILSKLDARYSKYAVFITFVYRHGLLHQHAPKNFEYKKKDISWMFNINNPNNPIDVQREFHLRFEHNFLQIDMNVFYKDVVDSIDLAYEEIIKSYKEKFDRSVFIQASPLNKTNILKRKQYAKFIKNSDFTFFKKI